MAQLNGVHHIAVMAADIKTHIAFFADVLGCELKALFHMHGVPGGHHAFLKLNDHCSFSIVQLPAVKNAPIQIGVTHAGSGAGASAPGTMQHLAFSVATRDDLIAMRDRIRKHGVNVFGPIDHGMCQSIYFAGPDQMTLEVAWSDRGIDAESWIDPEVCALAGITEEELARFKRPEPYAGEGGAVAQPPMDPAKPHQAYPKKVYEQILATPDDVLFKVASYAEPPVKKAS